MNGKLWIGLVAVGLLAGGALGQSWNKRGDEPPPGERPAPVYEGFWPTQRMMELYMHRAADQLAERYQFDDDQLLRVRETLKERMIPFLNAQRAAMQPLINEFIEARLGDEAPDVDYVSDWAQRVLPLVDEFTGVVGGVTEDMREYLDEDQLIIMEGELAAFRTGLGIATNKLNVWADGGFDPERDFALDRHERRRRKREERRQTRQAMDAAREQALEDAREGVFTSGQGARPARPEVQSNDARRVARSVQKDAWARYVDEFVKRYKFNDEQKSKANQLLDTIRQKRDAYFKRKLPAMERIEQNLKEAKNDEQRDKVKAELEKLNQPVERLFEQLKKGLNKLPTRLQRRAVAQAEAERRAGGRRADPASKPPGRKPIE